MINFLAYRSYAASISLAILIVSVGAYIWRGGFNYSVDFAGGTQVLLRFDAPVESETIKDILRDAQLAQNAIIREFSAQEKMVRVKEFQNDAQGLGERMAHVLRERLAGVAVEVLSVDSVGAGVGAQMRWKSMIAIMIALMLMLLYIAIRFQFAFAVGAIVALLHDAVAIPGFFLLFNKEITIDVIAAVLTILGYSINDTIVIFAKIRENLGVMRSAPLEHIVNVSISKTLRRTILTSVATALVVIALLLFGGEALHDLALALLIGIIVGTYSSIYVASPVMMLFQGRHTA